MAKNNYGFQKRSRELAKKKKKEEKRLRKLAKDAPEVVEQSEGTVDDEGLTVETASEAEEQQEAIEIDRCL